MNAFHGATNDLLTGPGLAGPGLPGPPPRRYAALVGQAAWLKVGVEHATALDRHRFVNLGAGAFYAITVTETHAPGEPPGVSLAALHHAGGTLFLDEAEAQALADCLDVIAAR